MDHSTRSAHARLAALIRHHGEGSPEVSAARLELEQARTEASSIRRRIGRNIGGLSATDRRQLLDLLGTEEGAAS